MTVYAAAAAELRRAGWRHYRGASPEERAEGTRGDGPCCLVQAVTRVVDIDSPAYDRALRAIQARVRGSIGAWNDQPGRTVDDVYALLDALDAEERGT